MAATTPPARVPSPGDFLLAARAIDAGEVVSAHADVELAEKNVAAGTAAVLRFDAHVAEHLPHVDLRELRSLPELARAVVDAAREAGSAEDGDEEVLHEAYALRRRLRAAALALREAGVLTLRDVAKLGSDRGAVDVAADCSALAALFQRRASDLEGIVAFADGDVARAAQLGASLRARWKPAGPARSPGADGLSAIEKRDRLWTLLVQRHERLWAVGAYVYGHAVDEQVPALHAPVAAQRARAKRS